MAIGPFIRRLPRCRGDQEKTRTVPEQVGQRQHRPAVAAVEPDDQLPRPAILERIQEIRQRQGIAVVCGAKTQGLPRRPAKAATLRLDGRMSREIEKEGVGGAVPRANQPVDGAFERFAVDKLPGIERDRVTLLRRAPREQIQVVEFFVGLKQLVKGLGILRRGFQVDPGGKAIAVQPDKEPAAAGHGISLRSVRCPCSVLNMQRSCAPGWPVTGSHVGGRLLFSTLMGESYLRVPRR